MPKNQASLDMGIDKIIEKIYQKECNNMENKIIDIKPGKLLTKFFGIQKSLAQNIAKLRTFTLINEMIINRLFYIKIIILQNCEIILKKVLGKKD